MEYAQMNPAMTGHLPFQQFGGVLPPGWLEYRTPTGQPYWYNTFTRQSSWQFPVVAVPQPQKKKQIKKKIPDTNWLFVLTPDGYEFYYDRDTKTSVWEMPEELKEPMEKLRELEKQQQEEENKRKRALQEEEEKAKEDAKKVKLEQEEQQVEEAKQQQQQDDIDATEMTEDDIMWQLQQMEELSGEQMEEEEQITEEHIEEEQLTEQIKEEAVIEKKELTEQECIDQFNEMLREKNISPFATYSTELPKLMADDRFTMVKHNKQKALFNKYCKDLGEKMRQEKMNKKTPQQEFQELLESKVAVKMYWDDFRRKYKNDDRFQAIKSTKDKEIMFKEHVKNNLGKKKNSVTDDYIALLRETREIKQGIRWRDAKKILERDDRYYAIESKEKREDMFRDYLDTL